LRASIRGGIGGWRYLKSVRKELSSNNQVGGKILDFTKSHGLHTMGEFPYEVIIPAWGFAVVC
jgi:hypothetical protein